MQRSPKSHWAIITVKLLLMVTLALALFRFVTATVMHSIPDALPSLVEFIFTVWSLYVLWNPSKGGWWLMMGCSCMAAVGWTLIGYWTQRMYGGDSTVTKIVVVRLLPWIAIALLLLAPQPRRHFHISR